jgi:phage shock protein E
MRARRGFLAAALVLLCAAACAPQPAPVPGVGAIAPEALAARIASGDAPLVLDVRTPAEFEAGHVPGAVNIPHDALASRIDELADHRDDEIVVHCQSGRRAGIAEDVLEEAGFRRILDLTGHWKAWKEGGYPVE